MYSCYVDYLDRLKALHDDVRRVQEGLPTEALDWLPRPGTNSISVLVVHLTGAERYWIGDVAAGEPSGRDRDAEFRTAGKDAATLSDCLDGSLAYARETLAGFCHEELAELRTSPRDGQAYTVAWALLHALEHTALHLGHIQLTADMWRALTP